MRDNRGITASAVVLVSDGEDGFADHDEGLVGVWMVWCGIDGRTSTYLGGARL
jgi:hypothetical protein